MKIAKCKYCGAEPFISPPTKGMLGYLECPCRDNYEEDGFGTFEKALEFWNEINTDQHGHTLWVRENFRVGACGSLFFQAEEWHEKAKWRPSIHMPRWASRIDLLVKRVWVERVQDISEADAIAEGSYLGRCECLPRAKDRTPIDVLFQQTGCHIHDLEFKALWNSIYGKKPDCSWADNPWVWAVEFELKEVRG